jgi:LPXTG-motif cell wall-anchored protein
MMGHQESHQGDSQLFIVAHTIIAIALGILSLTGGFLLLSNRRRPA